LHGETDPQRFGEPLPDFSLPDMEGQVLSLSSAVAGKQGGIAVFWSSICSHCVRYDSYLNSFQERHPGFALVVVAARSGETLAAVRKAVSQRGLRFTVLHDPSGKIAGQWFTQQTPRAFLMDSNRRLLYRGAIDNYKFAEDPGYLAHLEPAIEQFLAGAAIKQPETASFGCAIQSVYYTLPKAL
jgi:peroxiredoxin